jgi:hypothetical protein
MSIYSCCQDTNGQGGMQLADSCVEKVLYDFLVAFLWELKKPQYGICQWK